MVEPDRPQMKVWRMRIACCIPKATNTHLEYVILLFRWNNGCTNAPHCYAIRTLPALLKYNFLLILVSKVNRYLNLILCESVCWILEA